MCLKMGRPGYQILSEGRRVDSMVEGVRKGGPERASANDFVFTWADTHKGALCLLAAAKLKRSLWEPSHLRIKIRDHTLPSDGTWQH